MIRSPKWRPHAPLDEAWLADFEGKVGVRFPDEIRQVWLASNGGYLDGVFLYDDDHLEELNLYADDRQEHIPEALVFGNDGGDLLYYFDPRNRLGRGAWAVYGVTRGAIGYADSYFLAPSFAHFVERVLAGEEAKFTSGPDLKADWTEAHRHEVTGAEIERLYFETLIPEKLVPKNDVDLGDVPCAAGQEVHLSRQGRVEMATLARAVTLDGIPLRQGTQVVRYQRLHRFTPDVNLELHGVPCLAGHPVTLPTEYLDHFWATLAEERSYEGIPCAAGAPIEFSGKRLAAATLAEACTVDGVKLPRGATFERFIYGESVSLYTAEAPVEWEHDGKRHAAGERVRLS